MNRHRTIVYDFELSFACEALTIFLEINISNLLAKDQQPQVADSSVMNSTTLPFQSPVVKELELTNGINDCETLLRQGLNSCFNFSLENENTNDGVDETPYGHEWPASRLTLTDMARLRMISNQVRMPVNQLLKEAVEYYTTHKLPEFGVDPAWQWGDSIQKPDQSETAEENDTTQEEES